MTSRSFFFLLLAVALAVPMAGSAQSSTVIASGALADLVAPDPELITASQPAAVELPVIGMASGMGKGAASVSASLGLEVPPAAAMASGAAFLAALAGGAPIEAAGLLPTSTEKEIRLGMVQAVVSALEKNHDLRVRRFDTDISGIDAKRARTRFDPTVAAELSSSDRLERQISSGKLADSAANGAEGSVEVSRTSPNGTKSTIGLTMSRDRTNRAGNLFDTRVGVELLKPLRQGAGKSVNLVDVRQAELELKASQHELEGFILSLVAEVERKYWSFFLASRELGIVDESRRLAVQQLQDVQQKIQLGSIPESEQAAAEAELALREEAVIDARSAVETARLALLRLINLNSEQFWGYALTLEDEPEQAFAGVLQPPEHVAEAMANRPELLRARVLVARDELEVVRTRNGLLPKLDFFLTLGKSGYSQSFDRSVSEFGDRPYDLEAGLRYELFGGKRDARLADRKARFTREQREEALRNLTQVVQEDVLTAWLEMQRARQQLVATGKTVAKQAEKLRVEETKFEVGKNTAFQVAQAQRDFAASRIAELKARVACILAETELFRLDGSLCRRRGISVTGH